MRTQAILVLALTLGAGATETKPGVALNPAQGQLTRFEADGKYGFKDAAGKTVILPVYDDARDFSEGLAPVNLGAEWDHHGFKFGGRWGYINAHGELILPVVLEHAGPFSEGLALVQDSDGFRYIEATGRTAIRLDRLSSAGHFREGVAPVHLDGSLQGQDWLTRYINKTGQVVFEVKGYGEEFSEELAQISIREAKRKGARLEGFINHAGQIVIEPKYAEVQDFSDGLAAVRPEKTGPYYGQGDAWGYMDKSGNFVLKPQFNEAHPFCRGIARVHAGGNLEETSVGGYWSGGEWRLIDKRGNILRRSKDWLEYEHLANTEQ